MKQMVLSIAQMQKLEELGLDTSNARMIWAWEAEDDDWTCISYSARNYYWECMTRYAGYDLPDYIPAYTLQDILDCIKKANFNIELCINIAENETEMRLLDEDNKIVHYDLLANYENRELLCAYNILIWYIENRYIITKQTDKE